MFEELTQQILLPCLKDPLISILIDFSEKTGDVSLNVKYNGERFDPKDSENDLSYGIIKSMCSSVEYEYKEAEKPANRAVFRIRQEHISE